MRTDQFVRCSFEDELASLIARKQSPVMDDARHALFEALLDLEHRARAGKAPPSTLRKIAEIRFLVGILRDAVRPFPVAPLRMLLRLRDHAASRDVRRPRAAADLSA